MARGCGCSNPVAGGCQCSFVNSDCIQIVGSGSNDNPVQAIPKLNASSKQLLTCTPTGLLGQLPVPLDNPPAVFVYRSSDLNNIPDGATTVVAWNAELYDPFGMHAANDFNLIAVEDGIYTIFATMLVQPETTSGADDETSVSCNIRVNSQLVGGGSDHTVPGGPNVLIGDTLDYPLEAGDSVDVTVRHGYDVEGRIVADGQISHFGMTWRRALP